MSEKGRDRREGGREGVRKEGREGVVNVSPRLTLLCFPSRVHLVELGLLGKQDLTER